MNDFYDAFKFAYFADFAAREAMPRSDSEDTVIIIGHLMLDARQDGWRVAERRVGGFQFTFQRQGESVVGPVEHSRKAAFVRAVQCLQPIIAPHLT